VSGYCFDTDVLSAVLRRDPPLALVRRLARLPASEQSTTAINVGELVYGAARRGSPNLTERVRELIDSAISIIPFDRRSAEVYGELRAALEQEGRRLDEPDLRIAAIVRSRGLTLVTGNLRHFDRVPGLRLENWLRVSE
jgi:tRNA(fMet)-specific endonuclease VapC